MTEEIKAECPHCGYKIDAARELREIGKENVDIFPSDGDASVCIRCAEVSIYKKNSDGSMGMRLPKPREARAIAKDKHIAYARAIVLATTAQ